MWNHSIRYYGHLSELLTLPGHEPLEWKSGWDVKGERTDDELLTAPPAIASSQMGLGHAPKGALIIETSIGRAGRVRPSWHINGGDGARGHRVSPPVTQGVRKPLSSPDMEDIENKAKKCQPPTTLSQPTLSPFGFVPTPASTAGREPCCTNSEQEKEQAGALPGGSTAGGWFSTLPRQPDKIFLHATPSKPPHQRGRWSYRTPTCQTQRQLSLRHFSRQLSPPLPCVRRLVQLANSRP